MEQQAANAKGFLYGRLNLKIARQKDGGGGPCLTGPDRSSDSCVVSWFTEKFPFI
jgi:hypothetical protein